MTVDHDTLTDPELHEPKGIAVAVADSVLVANGAGSGTWVLHSAFADPDIHEPKDVAGANSGEVYTADGVGGGSWAAPTVPVLTALFTSTDQTITAAGQLILAHGLSGTPLIVVPVLVNQTADLNYAPGDLVQIGYDADSTNNRGIGLISDATNITLRFGSSTGSFTVVNKTSGVRAAITNANWKLRILAYL